MVNREDYCFNPDIFADKFISYDDVKDQSTEDYFNNNAFSIDAFKKKYTAFPEETYVQSLKRVCDKIASVEDSQAKRDYWASRWFNEIYNDYWKPAGCIVQGTIPGRSVSKTNCTTTSLGNIDTSKEWDNLESIIRHTAYKVAKYAAYRQGNGIDFSALRPRKSKLLNAANESTGSVHWATFIDSISYYVGQKGRIPALLFSLICTHPDLEEFITSKSDYTKIQNANISVQCLDAFYDAVEKDIEWELKFEVPEINIGDKIYLDRNAATDDCLFDEEKGLYYRIAKRYQKKEAIIKTVRAKAILELIAKNMHSHAEPGIQNIDVARKYSNSDYVYDPSHIYDSRITSTNAPLVGSTLIPTINGIIPIKDLFNLNKDVTVIVDSIVTLPKEWVDCNGKCGPVKKAFKTIGIPVSAKFKKYENQKVWIITLSDGKIIKCNAEHRWLSSLGMTPTSELKINDKIFLTSNGLQDVFDFPIDTNSNSYKEGELIGYFVGDGFFVKESDSHHPIVGIVYTPDCNYYANLFQNKYSEITGHDNLSERNRDKIKEIRTENQNFVKYIKSFGFIDNKYHVPQKCFTDINFCIGFLRGLFDADGSVSDSKITLTSVSKDLVDQVSSLLINWFGIKSTIKMSESKGVPYGDNKISNAKPRYDLDISILLNQIKFKKYIDLISNKKLELQTLCERTVGKERGIRQFVTISSIEESNTYEDMYCAVINGFHAFVVDGLISSNCSEQYLSPDSCCVLASANVGKFSTDPKIYAEQLKVIGYSINRFLDNVNECELRDHTYGTEDQKIAIEALRRTGAGFTNLAEWLFRQNLVYGSKSANAAVAEFQKIYNYYLYKSSIELGREKGSFGLFNREKLERSPFIQRMMGLGLEFNALRNITVSSIAPTGTLTLCLRRLAMSYGIEPAFDIYYWKRTRINGYYTYYFCVPAIVREIYANAGFEIPMSSDMIEDDWAGTKGSQIIEFIENHRKDVGVEFVNSNQVSPFDKLDMMAQVMKWVDSSISVTYQLPLGSTWQDVYDFILLAHKKEVKSIAAFPDKKMYGIVTYIPFKTLAKQLIAENVYIHPQNFTEMELKELNLPSENIQTAKANKRQKTLEADINFTTADGKKYVIVIGKQDGKPYEIFGGLLSELPISTKHETGKITKLAKNRYLLEFNGTKIDNLGTQFSDAEQFIFRSISMSLRHNIPIKFIVEQLQKSTGDMYSISSAIARVLKKYINNGESHTGQLCPKCQKETLVYLEGCVSCSVCNWSKCS